MQYSEENLANYTGEIYRYREVDGSSSAAGITATVSTQTTALTYVYYSITSSTTFFDDNGIWILWPEITSASGNWRAGEPVKVEVRIKGKP